VNSPVKSQRSWILGLVAIGVIALDQYIKHQIRLTMPINSMWDPIPALDHIVTFTHLQNTGAAFGMFTDTNTLFAILALIVSAVILVFSRQLIQHHWLLPIAFGLQMGGALGNVVDRVMRGGVTDFIDFHFWPVFNLADSSVVVGTILLAIYALFLDQHEGVPEASAEQESA
jgi:signal peptidase II